AGLAKHPPRWRIDSPELSSLLPADYCQLELPFHVQRTRTDLVWKSDIWFGDKALGLKATIGDVILYCQLGKMAVVRYINELRFSYLNRNPQKSANFYRSRIWKSLTETQRKRISRN